MSKRQRKLNMERMEARQMMAGDIAASVSGGTLYLNEASGQAGLDNSVMVSQIAPGRIRVTGNYTTTDNTLSKVNGAAFQDFNVSGGLDVKFGGGSDLVVFDQLAPATFTNVNIDLGAQPPVLSPMMAAKSAGGIGTTFNGPDKDNLIMWGANITGNLTVKTGADDDWVFVANTPISGNVSINTGAGVDTAQLKNLPGIIGSALDIQLYSSRAEKDADVAWLDHVYVNGNINVRTGDGADLMHLDNVTSYKDFNLDAGAGNDRLEAIDVCAVDNFFAKLGEGNDSANIKNLYVVDGQTQIDGGNGDDSLTKSGAFPMAQLIEMSFEWINGRPAFLGNGSVSPLFTAKS